MIGWIVIGVSATVMIAIALRIDDWGRDWTENVATLDESSQRPELRSIRLECDRQTAAQRIRAWVDDQSHWDFVSQEESSRDTQIALTRTTGLFKFVDEITVTIVEDTDGPAVRIRATSRSRIGKGDLGQNPRNLVELTRGIRSE